MFTIGQRVKRDEARDITGAEVAEVDTHDDGPVYRILYDEGGEGWWPEASLTAE